MEVSAALAKMQAEVICSVCLDYLSNPVTINCGHDFCASCLQMSWKDLQDTFPCPVCRQPSQERCFNANPQLGRLAELAKLLHSSRSQELPQKERRCEEHKQVLGLFCEDERQLVCPLCAQSPAHQGHRVRPVEEAASHYRQRFRGYTRPLKERLAQMQKLAVAQDKNLLQLKEKMGQQRRQLTSEFEQLNEFVERQQEAALRKLGEEEKRFQQQLDANVAAYSDYIATLKGLLGEVAERSVMREAARLREVRGLQQRCEGLGPPALQPLHCRRVRYSLPPLCMTGSNITQKFREHVSLDPQTAHPSLRVSEDLKSVTCVRKRLRVEGKPKTWEGSAELVVLGRESFASGRHYWEVQVSDKPEWAVGVCTDAPSSEEQRPLGRPDRCWAVELQDGDYQAVGSGAVPLDLKDRPTAIGVYLDYELGQVSFYNVTDKSHIHSFMATFVHVLKPYFRVGQDCTPLALSAGRD